MKTKIKVILILFIVISGFVFFHSRKDDYNLAKELEAMDETTPSSSSSSLAYFLPFIKSDFQKKVDAGEQMTFLLLGYGGEGHSGTYLTDTLILGRMDFNTGKVTMMNLPRDLWVNGQKINAIYANTQNVNDVVTIIEGLMDVDIEYYTIIDFDGFRQAVDELGGLEVYVETTFDDYNYPRNDNDQIDAGVMHIHFDEGWETMTGERALQYSRSRYSAEDGGDFNRSKRQQNVIKAFKDKALETKNLKTLYKYAQEHEISIENKILSEENFLYAGYNSYGSYILQVVDDDWIAVRDYFYSQE
ncbi:MAG: LCP family protein [Epsilonproteobacteria bacterium]|nr:LCP family protein [Campylobacterota bacterium]